MSRRVIQSWMGDLPNASLVTHWPRSSINEDDNHWIFVSREKVEPFLPQRQVAEVHTSMIGLTARDLIDWRKTDPENRRLAVIGPGDPRIEEHDLDSKKDKALMEAVMLYATVAYLKFGRLVDGDRVMEQGEVESAVKARNFDCPLGRGIIKMSERLGSEVEGPIHWVINVRGSDDLIKAQIEYVQEILLRGNLK